MRKSALVLFTVLLLLAAYLFVGRPWLQERSVKQAIVEYDLALTDAFLTGDSGELSAVATPNQRSSVASYLGLFELQGIRLRAELISLELIESEVTQDGATAEVQELWRYDGLSADGLSTGDRNVEASTLRYVLVRSEGRWMIDDVVVISTESREEVGQ